MDDGRRGASGKLLSREGLSIGGKTLRIMSLLISKPSKRRNQTGSTLATIAFFIFPIDVMIHEKSACAIYSTTRSPPQNRNKSAMESPVVYTCDLKSHRSNRNKNRPSTLIEL